MIKVYGATTRAYSAVVAFKISTENRLILGVFELIT